VADNGQARRRSAPRLHQTDDAADHASPIDPRTHLVRQQRSEPLELLLTQPVLARRRALAVAEPESHLTKPLWWVPTLFALLYGGLSDPGLYQSGKVHSRLIAISADSW
jgi:hypothetical protein